MDTLSKKETEMPGGFSMATFLVQQANEVEGAYQLVAVSGAVLITCTMKVEPNGADPVDSVVAHSLDALSDLVRALSTDTRRKSAAQPYLGDDA